MHCFRHRLVIYLALLMTAVLWGGSFVFTRYLFLEIPDLTPVILVTLRLLLASALLVPIVCMAGHREHIRREDRRCFFLLALLEPFLYFLFENSGLQSVSSGLASVLIATIPIFVPFGLYLAYREKLQWLNWLGLLLSLLGVLVMICGKDGGTSSSLKGICSLAGAVIVAVIYSVLLVKVVNKYKPYTVTMYTNLIGLFYFIPLFLSGNLSVLGKVHFTWKIWVALLCLGIGCSVLAYVLFNIGVRAVGAARASVFNNAIPIFTLLIAAALGMEDITLLKVVGILLTVIGVCLAQKKPGDPPASRTTCGIRTRGPQNENLIS